MPTCAEWQGTAFVKRHRKILQVQVLSLALLALRERVQTQASKNWRNRPLKPLPGVDQSTKIERLSEIGEPKVR